MFVALVLTSLDHAGLIAVVMNFGQVADVVCMQLRVAVGCEFRWMDMVLPATAR